MGQESTAPQRPCTHLDPALFAKTSVRQQGLQTSYCLAKANALYLHPSSVLFVSPAPDRKGHPHAPTPTERFGPLSATPGLRKNASQPGRTSTRERACKSV